MAAELVGGAFLSAFLQVLFDRMASPHVVDFIKGQKLNRSLFQKLEATLLSINAVLDDAEGKQILNHNVKKWLNELKDAVYDAEDLLDEVSTEASRCKLEAESQISSTTKVRKFFTSLNPFHKRIESKLQEILERFEYLKRQNYVLSLREGFVEKCVRKLAATSLVDESSVYGRDDDREAVMKLLLLTDDDSGNDGIGVVPIVGMGGIGKTTLAQIVYNDNRMKEVFNFDLKIWVYVSDNFDVFRVTKAILEAITSSSCEVGELNLLQVKLTECLMNKKFLLVLDDVWNENYVRWEALKKPLTHGARGSKIIVTTRNESVASIMHTVPSYHLQQLEDEQCWLLFAKHAFGNMNSSVEVLNLETIGKEIVKKCHGLPLAAKTVGGLLRSKRDVDEWHNVLESNLWDLSMDDDNIVPALLLSYHYLPSHLKRCFAYCAIFPKDYDIEIENLVLLWMAEGLLPQPRRNKRPEDVGLECFNNLRSRSFFQQSSGNTKLFFMHDLIHDLAKYVSEGFCLSLGVNDPCEIQKTIHHFSYARTSYDDSQKFNAFHETKCLRTFLPLKPFHWFEILPYQVYHDLLPTLKCLRVLTLSKYDSIKELPGSIGDLQLLRYMDLSCTAIERLPESVCALYNLLTLLLADCGSLNRLPDQMGRLANLRHLDISGTLSLEEMPLRMSKLANLQTLSAFILGNKSGSSISELGELQQLRGTLTIFNLQNVVNPRDALEAKFKDKEYLTELILKWSGHTLDTSTERDVLRMLQPHTNLEKLSIESYGGTKFPDWLGDCSYSNIVSLRLSHCKYCFFLPPLGQLPSLKELFIIGFDAVERVGVEFCRNGSSTIKPFRCLETLWFERMLGWQEWIFFEAEGHFPCLQELHIRKCPKLSGSLPDYLPSLRKLMIIDCKQLIVSLPQAPTIYELHLGYSDKVILNHILPGLHKFTIRGCSTLESLPAGIIHCLHLEELKICDCPSLSSLQDVTLSTLKRLDIMRCKRLELPMWSSYASLQTLWISFSCYSLTSFQLQSFLKLNHLHIRGCNLNSLSVSVSEGPNQVFPSLNSLRISLCPKFGSFPVGGLHAPNLTVLEVSDCTELKSLPDKMHSLLPSLNSLKICNCPELESFPEGGLPSNLNSFSVSFCEKFTANLMDWDLQTLSSLKCFTIRGKCEGVDSFPEEGFLPSTLTFLYIAEIPNLRSLNNKSLQHLTFLKKIEIRRCPDLQSMSGPELPESLCVLRIEECPSLKQRLQKNKGEDWPKVALVPIVEIDDDMVI